MYRKIISVFLCMSALLMLTGCAGSQNLKQKVIVEGVGIDFSKDEFSVTILYFKPQDPTSQSEQKTHTASVEAKTLGEAFSKISALIGKEPFYANNRIAVLGREAADQRLDEITDFFIRDSDMREDCYLLWADNAKKAFQNEKLSKADNNFIFTLLEKNVQNGTCAALTAMQASVCLQFSLGDIFMPRLDEQNGELTTSNTLLFSKGKSVKTIDAQKGFYLSLLLNEISRPEMSVETPFGCAAVSFLNTAADISADRSDNTQLDISVKVSCSVAERERSSVTDEMIKTAIQNTLERGIKDFLFITAEQGIDVIGLAKILRKEKTDYFIKNKQDTRKMISSLKFSVSVEAQIMRTGRKSR